MVLLVLLSSCGGGDVKKENADHEQEIKALDTEQVTVFAIDFEKAIKDFDSEMFKERFNDEGFIDLIIEKANIEASYNRQVIKKELEKAKISNSIFQILTSSSERMFKRAGMSVSNDAFAITYRISPDLGEIDYIMIIGRADSNGNLTCYDVMSLVKGDTYSTMFAEIIASNSGLTYELPEWNEHYQIMVEAENMGNATLAMDAYNKLPQRIKELKVTRLIHLRVAEALGEEELQTAANKFIDDYRNNDSLSLYNGFLSLKTGRCDEAMAFFNRADSVLLGGDSFTNIYRAHVSNCQGNYQDALKYLTKVDDMKNYTHIEGVTTAKMESLIGLEKYEEASEYLPTLFSSIGLDAPSDELVRLIYPDLYNTEEFKKWYLEQSL